MCSSDFDFERVDVNDACGQKGRFIKRISMKFCVHDKAAFFHISFICILINTYVECWTIDNNTFI